MGTPGIDLRFVGRELWRIARLAWLAGTTLWFVLFALILTRETFMDATLGGDAVLYAKAAGAWIHGQDPWLVSLPWGRRPLPVFYLAPPPTLLPFLPFAWLPAPVVAAVFVIADGLAALYLIRRLHISVWWLLFPPVFDCILVGNAELLMVALVVGASGPFAGLATLIKPYVVVPLIARRQWMALVVAGTIWTVTFPIMQWDRFLGAFHWIQWMLVDQLAFGDLSAWGFVWQGIPILVPVAAVSLLAYGSRAWWLAVPLLWPASQMHYAVLALPALSPWMAIGFGLPMPGARALIVIAGAVGIVAVRLWKWRSEREPSASGAASVESAAESAPNVSVGVG